MKRILMNWALVGIASLALTPWASAQEMVKADYVLSRALMGGEAEILEEGSLYFAGGRFRRDIQRRNELTTEILLSESRQRITMNHWLQVVQLGALEGRWPIPSRYLPDRPPQTLPGHRLPDVAPEERRYMQYETLGRRGIGGIIATGSRSARVLPDGRRAIIDIWLTPLSRTTPVPIKVEQVMVSYAADGSEVFREQMQIISTARIPLDESLFEPVGTYEVQEVTPAGRSRARISR